MSAISNKGSIFTSNILIIPAKRSRSLKHVELEYLLCKTIFVRVFQGIASVLAISIFTGTLSLYATLVCVACSQLEKLRASLLDIRQTYVTAERDSGADTDLQEAQGQAHASQELFRHMQQQLNNCIRHHQEIKRCR
jgi:hypothetical protein